TAPLPGYRLDAPPRTRRRAGPAPPDGLPAAPPVAVPAPDHHALHCPLHAGHGNRSDIGLDRRSGRGTVRSRAAGARRCPRRRRDRAGFGGPPRGLVVRVFLTPGRAAQPPSANLARQSGRTDDRTPSAASCAWADPAATTRPPQRHSSPCQPVTIPPAAVMIGTSAAMS